MSGYTYEQIKTLAREQGARVTDLLALAPQNDPFYTGAPATVEAAQWFATLWERFGFTNGVHLRRVHYQLVSHADITKPNGEAYTNTENDWTYLCNAGKYARYLELVDAEAFVDRRNPKPHVFCAGQVWWDTSPTFWIDMPDWTLPTIRTELAERVDCRFPVPQVGGYGYDRRNQPYHLELWIEKSTMDDVLLPLGEELGVNIVTSLGFQSITSVVALLKRIADRDRPARILYVSDFDPAGDGMPVAVARQVEFWLQTYAAGRDIALMPITLTRDQVERYRLPRIPVKDTDRRKAGFEERYGEGAVELDALEALHPGELARLVREAVAPYRDESLAERLQGAAQTAQGRVAAAWQAALEPFQGELAAITQEATALMASYKAHLEELRAALDAELAPWQDRLNVLQQAIRDARAGLDVTLPARPQPETADADESTWLYRSCRDYLAQMEVYKAHQTGRGG
jgi:hypothetical protein